MAPFVLPTKLPSKLRTMLFSASLQARTALSPLNSLRLAPSVVSVLIWVGIHSISLAARYRVAACSTTLSGGLEKINTARGHNCTPLFALSPIWEKNFLFPLLAHSTAGAFDIVCRLDRNDTLDEVRQNNKQKVATGLLLDKLHKLGSAGLRSSRASRALGPISRYRAAGARFCWAYFPSSVIELRTSCLMKIVSRASRPELTVGVIRILCNGLCTAQRFHTEEHDDTCRVGCPNEPDSLSDYNECLRLYDRFTSCWRHATVFPRRNHDLITHLYLQAFIMGLR